MNNAHPQRSAHGGPQIGPEIGKSHPFGLRTIMELFDVGPRVAIVALSGAAVLIIATIAYFIHSAPPSHLTITTGPEGSAFQKNAQKYAEILEKDGIRLDILTSNGSLENLHRLADPSAHVDIAIAQAGITNGPNSKHGLVSLGSIAYQPLFVFYRGGPVELLSAFTGKRVAVGPEGSGTRMFALQLLALNGIQEHDPSGTTLLDWDAQQAYQGLLDGKTDAAFIMSEDASTDVMHKLLHSNDIHIMSFKQANAYSRKIDFLNVMDLPEGSIDFGKDIPERDVALLGPTVELVATKKLHPALSDLILEAATEVHNRAGMFQKRGEFPAPIPHAIRISDDAKRYFKSGKSLFYRYLPFWLASLASRIVVTFIPLLVILIPALRSIPAFFRWRIQRTIHRRYRELLALEKELVQSEGRHEGHQDFQARFDQVEEAVNTMRIPPRFADQFYGLRGHIDFVRQLVAKRQAS